MKNKIKPTNLTKPKTQITIIITLLNILPCALLSPHTTKPPPLPILPLPSSHQLKWQQSEIQLFFHFGPNTFTDSEWGSGKIDPSVFNPKLFDPNQWIRVAKDSGFSRVILTAKHHDGFCLWPSNYTEYSVRSSKWRNGGGDVVGELARAAKEGGVGLGLYLSPWDRHEGVYGKTLEYNEFYMGQMTELLTRYGEIKEVWLDGAKGQDEKDMDYFFDTWFSLIHQLQPGAVIFSDAGPDTRWIGDEAGVAGSTCWSLFDRSVAKIGATDPQYSRRGDPNGPDWVPAECDVSIRPGWFWHASEQPKSAEILLDIYFKSVGRNCKLLLNLPPNSSGLISPEDIQVLQEFNELRTSIFSNNLAKNALLDASSTRGGLTDSRFKPENILIDDDIYTYWAPEENQANWVLFINLQKSTYFNILLLQEPIQMGQRIVKFHVDVMTDDGCWRKLVNGTTVGYKRLMEFHKTKSQYLRLVVEKSRADPLISYLGLYMNTFAILGDVSNTTSRSSFFNDSQVIQEIVYKSHHKIVNL